MSIEVIINIFKKCVSFLLVTLYLDTVYGWE